MSRPVFDPDFWKQRMREAPSGSFHHAVYRCTADKWREIEARHRRFLARHVDQGDRILDAGCAWGRLLELLPSGWLAQAGDEDYVGIDLSPDFIDMARCQYPARLFMVADLRNLSVLRAAGYAFDVIILVSIRAMIVREMGQQVWGRCEKEIRSLLTGSGRVLFLEYEDPSGDTVE